MYGNRHFGERRSFAPVNVGDELDLIIEAVGEKGDGIAKIKGFVIFVPNAKKGDEVRVKITKVLRKVGFGEIMGQSIEKPKKSRKKEAEEGAEEEMQAEAPEEEFTEAEGNIEESEEF